VTEDGLDAVTGDRRTRAQISHRRPIFASAFHVVKTAARSDLLPPEDGRDGVPASALQAAPVPRTTAAPGTLPRHIDGIAGSFVQLA
jgi:hypothetical protein